MERSSFFGQFVKYAGRRKLKHRLYHALRSLVVDNLFCNQVVKKTFVL